MARCIPSSSDFPPNTTVSIIPAPPSSSSLAPQNILLLLHGFGDTHTSFASLGRSMALPETLCISVRGPAPLPMGLGAPGPDGSFHWGDDVVFDPSKPDGGMDVEAAGYSRAVKIVAMDIIKEVLVKKCKYSEREILIMGMGQGGTVGLAVASSLDGELGGVVSLGGALPEKFPHNSALKHCKTPVLVTHGKSKSMITTTKAKEIKDRFEFVEVHQWNRQGDGMATTREEMLPIMKFFASRLRSRAGVPKGAVEIR